MRVSKSKGLVLTCATALAVGVWLAACNPAVVVPETPLPLAWQTQVGSVINRPAVSENRVFVVDEFGKLLALDIETGKKRWQANLVQSNHGDDPVGVDGGTLFAMVQGDAGQVLAFDAQDAVQQWAVPSGPSRHSEHPIVHEGVVYFEATDPDAKTANLRAVDAATGAMVWEFPIGSYIATSPIVGTGLVYAGAYQYDGPSTKTRSVFALDAATGELRWTYPSDLDLSGKFALDDDHLYVGADGGVVIARDAATGEPAWTARVGGRLSNSPTVVGGLVYVGTSEGQMVALNAEDGAPRWSLAVGSPVLSQAAVADGIVYFGTNDGYLYAVDAQTGEEKWKIQSPLREQVGAPDYVPAMATTPVITDDPSDHRRPADLPQRQRAQRPASAAIGVDLQQEIQQNPFDAIWGCKSCATCLIG